MLIFHHDTNPSNCLHHYALDTHQKVEKKRTKAAITTSDSDDHGIKHAKEKLRDYTLGKYMSKEAIEAVTGWTEALQAQLCIARSNADNPEDCMYSEGTTLVIESHQTFIHCSGQLKQVHDDDNSTDILHEIHRARFLLQSECYTPPGLSVWLSVTEQGSDAPSFGASHEGSIFEEPFLPSRIVKVGGSASPPTALNLPLLTTDTELTAYGLRRIAANERFRVASPQGIAAVNPVYVGKDYAANMRGGWFLEKHAAIHLWVPGDEQCGGFIVVAILTESSHGHREFRLAGVEVHFNEALVLMPQCWHCDWTCSGGVWNIAYGFNKGPEGHKSSEVVGLQPITCADGTTQPKLSLMPPFKNQAPKSSQGAAQITI